MAGLYIARKPLKVQNSDGSVGDVAAGDTLTNPEDWAQFRTLLRFGHIERVEIPRHRCGACERDFKDAAGLKRHNTRKHKAQ